MGEQTTRIDTACAQLEALYRDLGQRGEVIAWLALAAWRGLLFGEPVATLDLFDPLRASPVACTIHALYRYGRGHDDWATVERALRREP